MPDSRLSDGVTKRQRDLLWRAFVRDSDGYLEAWQVGLKAGRTESAARSALRRLEARGLVECEIPDPFHPGSGPFKWSVTDAGREVGSLAF